MIPECPVAVAASGTTTKRTRCRSRCLGRRHRFRRPDSASPPRPLARPATGSPGRRRSIRWAWADPGLRPKPWRKLYKNRSPGKWILRDYFQENRTFPKIVSLTENQFSGKNDFYTIGSRSPSPRASRERTSATSSPPSSRGWQTSRRTASSAREVMFAMWLSQ